MTSRLYQKRQKENLNKKLRFIPDNHGPDKKARGGRWIHLKAICYNDEDSKGK